ncbi:MAG: hypothetical protein H0T21_01605 [Gemmatimonadaceae bacterium]|nr:hypothetical protein [Gemmatimonadaceae bacterium]
MNQFARAVAGVAILGIVSACASGGMGGAGSGQGPGTDQTVSAPEQPWPIKTREHVDLWLHGFAMVQEDTTFVPFFKRGYSSEMTVLKNRANVVTQLDANRDKLRARLVVNPALINAQFVPLSFASWDELSEVTEQFLRAEGNPNAAQSREMAMAFSFLAANFPTGADRDWLRLFVQSLRDESSRFYHSYWLQQQRERAGVLSVVDTLWQRAYRPKMQRFLNNTGQASGDVILSLPLNGEGRTQSNGKQANIFTVTFPVRESESAEAIYVIAHEAIGNLANTAVTDNITPEQRRTGVGERYTSAAAVRGGALLLQRVAPELVDGYARYYLRAVNRPAGANPMTTLATVFSLPETIRDALNRQLEVVLGGI